MREINNSRHIRIAPVRPAPFLGAGKCLYYGSGREAVLSVARAIGEGPSNSVLLPAYVPEGLIEPFKLLGWTLVLYKIDRNLDPEWEDLGSLLSEFHPKLAILIHYFGLQKDITRFVAAAHETDSLVIEDLAHVLPADGCQAGITGDLILYSPPKLFGVIDGGILLCRRPIEGLNSIKPFPDFLRGIYLAQQLGILAVSETCSLLPAGLPTRLAQGFARVFFNSYPSLMGYFKRPHRMSSLSMALLARADWNRWATVRREHAQRYASGLNKAVFHSFTGPLIGKAGPYGYPVLVANRDSLARFLKKRGIAVGVLNTHWDFIPAAERDKHLEAVYILDRHVIFPVSQDLSDEEVQLVVSAANEWANEQQSG